MIAFLLLPILVIASSNINQVAFLPGVSVKRAYDGWIHAVWREGGGLGAPDSLSKQCTGDHVLCERSVSPIGIRELIKEEGTDMPNRVAYTILNSGWRFWAKPDTYHCYVEFTQEEDDVEVYWNCDWEGYYGFEKLQE